MKAKIPKHAMICWENTGLQARCGDCVRIGCLQVSDPLHAGHIFIRLGYKPINAMANGKTRVFKINRTGNGQVN